MITELKGGDRNVAFYIEEGEKIKLMSCYDDVGTSYQYNLHGLQDTNIDPWGPANTGQNWTMIGRSLVRECLAKHASLRVRDLFPRVLSQYLEHLEAHLAVAPVD